MDSLNLGIIGGGLMGRELVSAAARWCHLTQMEVAMRVVGVCDTQDEVLKWHARNLPTDACITSDYRRLLADPRVQAVYVAVPHHLHREIYCAAIEAGKHLMGEKPFGIDLEANAAILACLRQHPEVIARCSSEFPFFPAVQRIARMIDAEEFGRILEVTAQFLHSSDLDPLKPINWKRQARFNGQYGCMGDLGLHVCHVPLRAGWTPRNVRAILSKVVEQRPDGHGGMSACDTWDNATLLCESSDPASGTTFPTVYKMQRIAPGERNTWSIEIKGLKACARFSTKNPKRLEVLRYAGGEQSWQQVDTGQETAFPTITGGIFEFGFSDAILQMWAAFADEISQGKARSRFSACVLPEETAWTHRLFTAALESHRRGTTEPVAPA